MAGLERCGVEEKELGSGGWGLDLAWRQEAPTKGDHIGGSAGDGYDRSKGTE